jgi:predicted dehydrogenase
MNTSDARPESRPSKSKARRPLGPNDRINLAVIGVGSKGGSHLSELVARSKRNPKLAVTAVCEIYQRRARAAQARVKKEATGKDFDGRLYHEYERLLDKADCDAVVIATPDHWHGKIACDAIAAGKDVYVEKPMCHTIDQARELCELTKRSGAVVQVGAQSTSVAQYHRAREMVKKGAIGKVVWVRSSYCRNVPAGDWNYRIFPDCTPETLDWDRFLGVKYGLAPKRPFDRERYFRFRKYWDYSGGIATDLLYHALAHLMVVLDEGDFPRRAVASGGNWVHKDRDVPDTFLMNVDYPGEYSIFLMGTDDNDRRVEEAFHGQHGTMFFGGPRLEPQGPFKAQFEQAARAGAQDVPLPRLDDHMSDFLQCMRTRARPHCHVELGYKTQVAISMAVMAYRQGRAMFFDARTGKVMPG